jgi:hypothetical protein
MDINEAVGKRVLRIEFHFCANLVLLSATILNSGSVFS